MKTNPHPLERWRLKEEKARGKPYPRYRLAEDLDCSQSRLSQIIAGGEKPSGDLLLRIRELTGISADRILDAAAEPADAR